MIPASAAEMFAAPPHRQRRLIEQVHIYRPSSQIPSNAELLQHIRGLAIKMDSVEHLMRANSRLEVTVGNNFKDDLAPVLEAIKELPQKQDMDFKQQLEAVIQQEVKNIDLAPVTKAVNELPQKKDMDFQLKAIKELLQKQDMDFQQQLEAVIQQEVKKIDLVPVTKAVKELSQKEDAEFNQLEEVIRIQQQAMDSAKAIKGLCQKLDTKFEQLEEQLQEVRAIKKLCQKEDTKFKRLEETIQQVVINTDSNEVLGAVSELSRRAGVAFKPQLGEAVCHEVEKTNLARVLKDSIELLQKETDEFKRMAWQGPGSSIPR